MTDSKGVKKRKKDRSQVVRYEHFEELVSYLESGWSPPKVHECLVLRYGDAPEEWTIRRWRDARMPEVKILPPGVMQEKLKGVDYKVDVIANLGRLIPMLEDRAMRWYQQEVNMAMVLPANDGPMRLYLDAVQQYFKTAQDLGLVKAPPPIIDMSTKTIINDPELIRLLAEAAKDVAALESKRTIDVTASRKDQG